MTTANKNLVSIKDLNLSRVKTGEILKSLQSVFDVVSSGDDYNKEQVKNMTSISNAMIKVLRFEFDVYRFFNDKLEANK